MNMFMNYCVFCDIVKCNSENNSKISVGVMNNRSNLIYQNDPKFKEKVIENDIKNIASLDVRRRLEMLRLQRGLPPFYT